MIDRIFSDPLTHFLILGAVLFGLYDMAVPDSRTIVVTRDDMAVWMQFRNKAFSAPAARAYLDGLDGADKDRLVQDYVREEALYRRALELGLDANDAILRRRLVQKMEYVALGLEGGAPELDEADLRDYFKAHRDDYRIPPWVSFTHRFFDGPTGQARAAAALKAGTGGDRFLYRRDYAEASQHLVADHLGAAIAGVLFDEKTPTGDWIGPLQSPHGWHLIRIAARAQSRLPTFEDVAEKVAFDAVRAHQNRTREKAIATITDRYRTALQW